MIDIVFQIIIIQFKKYNIYLNFKLKNIKIKMVFMEVFMIEIDMNAPSFCLKDQDEKEVCLKDFKGKWVILYFYPKDGTKGCTAEAIDFTAHKKEFERMDAIVIGLSPDSCKSHLKFRLKNDLEITLLSDFEHEVLQKYGVWQKKKMYGREYLGVVRSTYIINPEGKVSYFWEKVKVPGHVDEVKKKLKELKGK